jgi:formylglycine-generating enzyme required for sulfatase activity
VRRAIAPILILLLAAATLLVVSSIHVESRGFRVPAWAQVSQAQIDEAKMRGVPVAFENDIGMRFVLIPAGTFGMGSPEDEEGRDGDEGPSHEVTLAPFYLAVTEVTNAQYRQLRTEHHSPEGFDGDDQPAVMVSHDDAEAFVRWLSERETGAGYRLPSEAEWEYACRAGTTTRYGSGDTEADLERVGWYRENSGRGSHAVRAKPANPWGLHDMHGNVWEWCEDAWHDSYGGAPDDGSAWVDQNSGSRVTRGGSWDYVARAARSSSRGGGAPGFRYYSLGVRPARSVTP